MVDLNVLRVFAAAAEASSFSKAAMQLDLTRSAVAKAVARLEQRTGKRLFQRTTHVMTLTDEGEALYMRCSQSIAELDAALRETAGSGDEPSGVLRLTVPDVYGRNRILPKLVEFLDKWPDLRADVNYSDRPVDIIAEGYDLAVRIGGRDIGGDLIARTIDRMRSVMCASPRYLERHGVPASIDELQGHSCLRFTQHGRPRHWSYRDTAGALKRLNVNGRVDFDSVEALRHAAVAGLGIIQLPDFIVEGCVQSGTLVPVLEDYSPDESAITAIYPTRKFLAPRVRQFLDTLANQFSATISPAG